MLVILFSGFGSVSPSQDFSVSFFWVRESQYSTGFFRLLFLGSGVSVLHRIFPSPEPTLFLPYHFLCSFPDPFNFNCYCTFLRYMFCPFHVLRKSRCLYIS